MTTIEDRLRDSLHSYATVPRPPAGAAETAIAGVRAVRRRQVATAGFAGVIAVAVVFAGALMLDQRGQRSDPTTPPNPSPTATSNGAEPWKVRVDILDNKGKLHTTEGRTFDLSSFGRVGGPTGLPNGWLGHGGIARVPDGWLFLDGDGRVRLLRLDGTTISLEARPAQPVDMADPRLAISADGRSVAWREGTRLSAARLTSAGLQDKVSTQVPENSFALTWIGRRVVVGEAYAPGCCGYAKTRYDVWDPTQGDFTATWTADLAPIYGPVPEDGAAFGMVSVNEQGAGCLVQLDGVRDLSVTKDRVCLPGLHWGSLMGMLSPDGRHLVELNAPTESLVVVEIPGVAETKRALRQCPASEPLVWEDNKHFLAVTDKNGMKGVIRCAVDGSDTFEFNLGSAGLGGQVVRRYGV